MKNLCLAAALFSLWIPSLSAQTVHQAGNAKYQPQINRDEGGFSSCGVRAVVTLDTGSHVEVHDFSINIYAKLDRGLLKAGKSETKKADALQGKFVMDAVTPAPVKFWIAPETAGKPLLASNIKNGAQSPGFLLGTAGLVQTLETILAMIGGTRMQFVTRYKNQDLDRVISFGAAMPDEEAGPLEACLQGVIDRMTSTSEEVP